jgi:hypothetical protein
MQSHRRVAIESWRPVLVSRSLSTLFVASLEVRRDLCMASRAIRSLLHEVDRYASQCEDAAHLLRAFQVDVGGC